MCSAQLRLRMVRASATTLFCLRGRSDFGIIQRGPERVAQKSQSSARRRSATLFQPRRPEQEAANPRVPHPFLLPAFLSLPPHLSSRPATQDKKLGIRANCHQPAIQVYNTVFALVMGRLVHTSLGSSYLIAHVLHCPPPSPHTAL